MRSVVASDSSRHRVPVHAVQLVRDAVLVPLGVDEDLLPKFGSEVRLRLLLGLEKVQPAADVLVAPRAAQEVLDDEAVVLREHGADLFTGVFHLRVKIGFRHSCADGVDDEDGFDVLELAVGRFQDVVGAGDDLERADRGGVPADRREARAAGDGRSRSGNRVNSRDVPNRRSTHAREEWGGRGDEERPGTRRA